MRCSKCKREITGKYIKLRGFVIHKECVNDKIQDIIDGREKRKKRG